MNSIWENRMSSWRSRVFTFALMAGAAFPALAQNAIQSINSSQQAGSAPRELTSSGAERGRSIGR